MHGNAFPRIAPFVLYMAFVGLEEGLRFFVEKGVITLSPEFLPGLYPIKALSVALILFMYRKRFQEVRPRDLSGPFTTLISILLGVVVFVLWVNMDFPFMTFGNPQGYDPNIFQDYSIRIFMITARLFGAVLVVPVMEELFWRSFLIRYIIDQDFSKVPIGRFTWSSFLITSALFGLEHNLFLAGIMAGILYNLLLYYTKSLSQCIIAHAITNLALGTYVLHSGKWYLW